MSSVDVDDGERPAAFGPRAKIDKAPGCLDLAGRDRIENVPHLAFEHAARHCVERDLGFVAGFDPLQRILLEGRAELLVALVWY